MDRTTLGRNILPLQRDGLIEVVASPADRRRRELRLTEAGRRSTPAAPNAGRWRSSVSTTVFGGERAAALRGLLREVVAVRLRRQLGQGGITPRKARRLASGERRLKLTSFNREFRKPVLLAGFSQLGGDMIAGLLHGPR